MKNATCAAMLLLMLCACAGNKPTNEPPKPAPETKQPTQQTSAPPADRLIAADSVGPVKLGMTVKEARAVLPGLVIERTADGEGLALIAVSKGDKTLMILYAGEEDPNKAIDENAKIEVIDAIAPDYATAAGAHPEMSLGDAEKIYGKVTELMLTEIESREYATFEKSPPGISYQVISDEGSAGIYPEGQNVTKKYNKSAKISAVIVNGVPN